MRLCDWLGRTGAKAKAKKTPEEIAEENERTNEVGLFNPADAYLLYAKQLIENPPAHLRFDAPIDFLLFHAAELYLKSYLRQKGEDVEALKRFGHYRLARSSGTSRGEQFVG